MPFTRLFAFAALTAGILIALTWGQAAMAADAGPAYEVTRTVGDVEFRQYQPSVAVQVTVAADREASSGQAFRFLFDYIRGNNGGDRKIAMTAPVTQTPTAGSDLGTEIAMTTPVTQVPEAEGWSMAFFLPREFTPDTAPIPNDDRIELLTVPGDERVVLRFSGRPTDERMAEREAELRAFIEAEGVQIEEPAIYAIYNAPFTPWFLRRNEVMFKIAE
ncbi:MAG: heme-binding protein [Alphaproteobacteria bacterium]|nr:heme-binding protein [Alphaproteobacteria bacterium SS10]